MSLWTIHDPPDFYFVNFIAPFILGDWLPFLCFSRSCHWLDPTVSQPSLVFWLFRWKHVHMSRYFSKPQLIHTLVPQWVYHQANWALLQDKPVVTLKICEWSIYSGNHSIMCSCHSLIVWWDSWIIIRDISHSFKLCMLLTSVFSHT